MGGEFVDDTYGAESKVLQRSYLLRDQELGLAEVAVEHEHVKSLIFGSGCTVLSRLIVISNCEHLSFVSRQRHCLLDLQIIE